MTPSIEAKIDRLKAAYKDRATVPLRQEDVDEVVEEIKRLTFQGTTQAMRHWALSATPGMVKMLRQGRHAAWFKSYMDKLVVSMTSRETLFYFKTVFEAKKPYTGTWKCLYTPDEVVGTYITNNAQSEGRITEDGRFIVYSCEFEAAALESWKDFWSGKCMDFVNSKGVTQRIKNTRGAKEHFNNADFEIVNVETKEIIACSIMCE